MYLQCLPFLHTDMTQVVGILPHVRQGLFHTANIIAADDLVMQGAMASAANILN